MAERQGESDPIAAVKRLTNPSATERRRADAIVYEWIVWEVKYLLGEPSEGAPKIAKKIAKELTSRMSSDERIRRKVLDAEHPRRVVQGKILQAICDEFRRQRERLSADSAAPAKSQESALEVLDRLWELYETADALSQLFGVVSEEHQSLLKLRYFEGLSIRQIAERLDKEYHAVAGRLLRLQESLFAMMMGAEV